MANLNYGERDRLRTILLDFGDEVEFGSVFGIDDLNERIKILQQFREELIERIKLENGDTTDGSI